MINHKVELKSKMRRTIIFLIFLIFTIHSSFVTASEKWPGVDETVVEKVAEEHGRKAISPLINTDQGDLLLFVFLVAGAIGGFLAGYCWKTLTTKNK